MKKRRSLKNQAAAVRLRTRRVSFPSIGLGLLRHESLVNFLAGSPLGAALVLWLYERAAPGILAGLRKSARRRP